MCHVNSYKTEKFDYYDALSLTGELRCLKCTCLWLHDRWANHLLGLHVIDAKAGAVSRSFRYTLSLPHEVDGHAAVDSIL